MSERIAKNVNAMRRGALLVSHEFVMPGGSDEERIWAVVEWLGKMGVVCYLDHAGSVTGYTHSFVDSEGSVLSLEDVARIRAILRTMFAWSD